ncbi:MAG TPA: hypothetical protein VFH89_14595 [Sphingomicrobium sp.]|nr:hypothetical protein [Sphingomicrobium sp.]
MRSELPMLRRDRQNLFRKARARPSTIFAFAPDTAGEVGIALGVLKHPTKVGGREFYSAAMARQQFVTDQIVIDASVDSDERLLCSFAR